MSQQTGNKPDQNQGNSGRGFQNEQRKRSEGFEGMNYEQIRQPYNSRHTEERDKDDITNNGSGKRRDEL